jgi:hypothetical protein
MLNLNNDNTMNNNNYIYTPYIGISGIISERYKIDIGTSLDSFYGGLGIKIFDWK